MTSSTNDSPPSGKKKAECLEYVMKCARQQELLEADLAKRKKLEKKKAEQAKAAAEARVLFQGLQFNTIIMPAPAKR